MTNSDLDRCCDESRKNIPWYVNGTLSDKEAAALAQHLECCSDCQADLRLHEEMHASVLSRELTPMKPATRAEDIVGVDDYARQRQSPVSPVSLIAPHLIAVAAGVAILAVGMLWILYPGENVNSDNQLFQTATSTNSSGNIDYILQVQFEENVAEADRARIAAELDGAIKWAVNDKGLYEVHIQFAEPTIQVLHEYEEFTDSIEGVQSARFTALQFPVR